MVDKKVIWKPPSLALRRNLYIHNKNELTIPSLKRPLLDTESDIPKSYKETIEFKEELKLQVTEQELGKETYIQGRSTRIV